MSAAASSVGAMLRAAREAAGLSEDAVAQQLKLAPRQVRAIEEDDYARLPGRTFVRGFVRNYARLVHLDADAVVAALPAGEAVSPLERLTYTPSSRPMGEIPMETPRRGGNAARWLIPLVLLAVVGVAAYYEFARPPAPRPAVQDGIMPPPAPKLPAPSNPAVTPLPNPLDAQKSEAAPPASATEPVAAKSVDAPASVPASPPSATVGAGAPASPPAANAAPAGVAPASAPSTAASEPRPAAAADAPLVLSFAGTAWVQVKDATGVVIVSQTSKEGSTLPVAGRAPFSLVIGSADKVQAKFRGQPVDLAPHTVHNVARLTLK